MDTNSEQHRKTQLLWNEDQFSLQCQRKALSSSTQVVSTEDSTLNKVKESGVSVYNYILSAPKVLNSLNLYTRKLYASTSKAFTFNRVTLKRLEYYASDLKIVTRLAEQHKVTVEVNLMDLYTTMPEGDLTVSTGLEHNLSVLNKVYGDFILLKEFLKELEASETLSSDAFESFIRSTECSNIEIGHKTYEYDDYTKMLEVVDVYPAPVTQAWDVLVNGVLIKDANTLQRSITQLKSKTNEISRFKLDIPALRNKYKDDAESITMLIKLVSFYQLVCITFPSTSLNNLLDITSRVRDTYNGILIRGDILTGTVDALRRNAPSGRFERIN